MDSMIEIILGDITDQDVDAIVNSANPKLSPGGGISGMIHDKAGSELEVELKAFLKKLHKRYIDTGQVVISKGHYLKAKWILHTIGPRIYIHKDSWQDLLRDCYINCLNMCVEKGIKSIAFPSIATNIYGCPIEQASKIAIQTVREYMQTYNHIEKVQFVLFSQSDFEIYTKSYSEM